MKTEYGIRWREFDRKDRLVTKEKWFKRAAAMDKFIKKREEKDNFVEVIAYSM